VYLTLSEPVALGRESDRLAWQLVDACRAISEADEQPVGVALVGRGGAFFTAPPRSAADCDAASGAWRAATAALAGLGPPTVTAMQGEAAGPALELALAADLRVAAADAALGLPEVRFGRIPSAGGTQRLSRAVGQGTALRLLLLGEMMGAEEALALGLIHRVARSDALDACLEGLLDALRLGAPLALSFTKEAIRDGTDLPLRSGLTLEADLAALLQTTEDRARGISAFKERATPTFEGR
jgi:enoyl-CoA hydratase/carnithine racemase